MIVLITRKEKDAYALAERLAQIGIAAICSPLVKIIKSVESAKISNLCDGADAFIFTSRNAVELVAAASNRRDLKVYCVGASTSSATEKHGYAHIYNCAALTGMAGAAAITEYLKNLPAMNISYFHGEQTAHNLPAMLKNTAHKIISLECYKQQAIEKFSDEAIEKWSAITDVPVFSVASANRFLCAAKGMKLDNMRAWAFSAEVANELDKAGFAEIITLPYAELDTLLDALNRYKINHHE